MNMLCNTFTDFWNKAYFTLVSNVESKVKVAIGVVCLIVSIFLFIMCTKGSSKSEMVNNWFLFWLSMIVFVVGLFYMLNV